MEENEEEEKRGSWIFTYLSPTQGTSPTTLTLFKKGVRFDISEINGRPISTKPKTAPLIPHSRTGDCRGP